MRVCRNSVHHVKEVISRRSFKQDDKCTSFSQRIEGKKKRKKTQTPLFCLRVHVCVWALAVRSMKMCGTKEWMDTEHNDIHCFGKNRQKIISATPIISLRSITLVIKTIDTVINVKISQLTFITYHNCCLLTVEIYSHLQFQTYKCCWYLTNKPYSKHFPASMWACLTDF